MKKNLKLVKIFRKLFLKQILKTLSTHHSKHCFFEKISSQNPNLYRIPLEAKNFTADEFFDPFLTRFSTKFALFFKKELVILLTLCYQGCLF